VLLALALGAAQAQAVRPYPAPSAKPVLRDATEATPANTRAGERLATVPSAGRRVPFLQVLSTGQSEPRVPVPSVARLSGKWLSTHLQIEQDLRHLGSCAVPNCLEGPTQRLPEILENLKRQPEAERALLVKRLVDRQVSYRPDSAGADIWSSPLETLGRGYGDCEDIVFATYALLLQAGFDAQALGILLLQNRRTGRGHAVLELRLSNGTSVVFDNTKRRLTLTVDQAYRDVASIRNGVFRPAVGPVVAGRERPARL